MKRSAEAVKINNLLEKKTITAISAVMIATYIIGIYILKLLYNCGFNEVAIFSPEVMSLNVVAAFVSTFVFFSGIFLLFLIPGWIFLLHFENIKKDTPAFIGLSFILTLAILITATTIFKIITPFSLGRGSLCLIAISIISVELISLWCRPKREQKVKIGLPLYFNRFILYIALILLAVVFVVTFSHRIIGQGLAHYDYRQDTVLSIPLGQQPDELEIFGLADSLRKSLLPYWDLEYADRFGFVFADPPLYPFISMFSMQFFGEGNAAFALPSMLFIIVTFFLIIAQGKDKQRLRFLICSLLLLNFFYFSLKDNIAFLHKGYFLIFAIIVSYEYLLRRNYSMFLLFAAATTLTKFYGIFFIVLGFAGAAIFFKERRPELMPVMLKYCYVLMGLAAFILIMGAVTGNTNVYLRAISVEHFLRFDHFGILSKIFPGAVVYNPSFNLRENLQFLLWCLQSTAFAFPVLFLFGKNKKENFYSFVALVYFVLVLFGRYQFMRYVIPLVPLTATVACSKIERWTSK